MGRKGAVSWKMDTEGELGHCKNGCIDDGSSSLWLGLMGQASNT